MKPLNRTEDMSDWRNWREGDFVINNKTGDVRAIRKMTSIGFGFDVGNCLLVVGNNIKNFCWHSRPTKATT
jgi:hypothetical protein